jgi:hypothetical protein
MLVVCFHRIMRMKCISVVSTMCLGPFPPVFLLQIVIFFCSSTCFCIGLLHCSNKFSSALSGHHFCTLKQKFLMVPCVTVSVPDASERACVCVCVYTTTWREREREREKESMRCAQFCAFGASVQLFCVHWGEAPRLF